MDGLSCGCPSTSRCYLGGISFSISRKRMYTVINPGNYNGAAVYGVVHNLVPSFRNKRIRKSIRVFKGDAGRVDRRRGTGEVNFIFRGPFARGDKVGRAIFRRVTFNLRGVKISHRRVVAGMVSVVDLLRVRTFVFGRPYRLSNKREREITLTSVVIRSPSVVIVSRPASRLSPGNARSMFRVVGCLGERGGAVILIRRGVGLVTRCTSRVMCLGSNSILLSKSPRSMLSDRVLCRGGLSVPCITILKFRTEDEKLFVSGVPAAISRTLGVFARYIRGSGKKDSNYNLS